MKRPFLFASLFFCTLFLSAQSEWVTSFGTNVPFSNRYLTGFGMSTLDGTASDTIEKSKTLAMDDLVRQVRVQISSELVEVGQGEGTAYHSYFTSVVKSSSQLELPGVDFKVETVRGTIYALAYLNKDSLMADLKGRSLSNMQKILEQIHSADRAAQRGDNSQAVSLYAQMLPLFNEVYSDSSVLRILVSGSVEQVFSELDNRSLTSMNDLIALEQQVNNEIERLRNASEQNLDQALAKLLYLLKEQGVKGGQLQNPSLTYQQTDFSSPFGTYAADKLAHVLEEGLPAGGSATVIEGSYWLRDQEVELLIQARDSNRGVVLGSASALFPASSLPASMELTPQNYEEALLDLMEFQEEALTDGSIHLDVWTNKGRNEDVLTFHEGEKLQVYFRVNQPCYLQLTYFLATGEKVLLEEKFYVGIDKVNRVVALPYQFDVVPPLGIERMVVTAFSTEPPTPPVVPATIEGTLYEVFDSMQGVVAQSRGLRRENTDESSVRTGEAQLAITTLSR